MWPCERIASKIKDLWKKYEKAVDSGTQSKIKPVRSQADKYPDSVKYLFTRQNIADLTAFGYEVSTLDFEFKISRHTTNRDVFVTELVSFHQNGITIIHNKIVENHTKERQNRRYLN